MNKQSFKNQNYNLIDKDPEEVLSIISKGTTNLMGVDFFRSLASHIIDTTNCRIVFIAECSDNSKEKIKTLVYMDKGTQLDNFEYEVAGTPCANVITQADSYHVVSQLEKYFPKLAGMESYLGVPIFLSSGEVIGHIGLLDNVPIPINPQMLSILKIFASRTGAEIERNRQSNSLSASMLRYKDLFEDSPIGICEDDFSQVNLYVKELKAKYKTDLATILNTYKHENHECYIRIKRIKANRAQAALFDLNTTEEYFDFLEKENRCGPILDLLKVFENGERTFEREMEITTAKGKKKILKVKRVILHGSEHDWSKSIISCMDITEQKQAESKLVQALSEVKGLKEKLEAENNYLQAEIKTEHNFEEIVSKSKVFSKVLDKIQLVAETDATVLITGETGTGKELIARGIHSTSKRVKRPLVKVNCAALPVNLIESELFGHERGAFTGALTQKIGRFELAHQGTLFLDEIGELPIELQSKLLRVLQEGEFERVGGSKTIKVDVRIIAATNRDLHLSVNKKEFRADLYYRLNVFPIFSPPLRDRLEDIPLLVNHFCKKFCNKFGKKITTIPKSAIDILTNYHWPGNVRELENIIERSIIVSNSNVLALSDWLPSLAETKLTEDISFNEDKLEKNNSLPSLVEVERGHIREVLKKTNGKIRGANGAAAILNLNPTTLEAKIKKLGIDKGLS